jgi:hypothetical protein
VHTVTREDLLDPDVCLDLFEVDPGGSHHTLRPAVSVEAVSGASSRGVGPAGVGTSASCTSSFSNAVTPYERKNLKEPVRSAFAEADTRQELRA